MKKSVFLALVLCVCLLFTACKATDPDNLFEMPLDQETVSTEPKEFKNYVGTYPYGNIQKDQGYLLLNNEILFTYNDNGRTLLYAYDLNTEEVRYYCGDATCSHNSCVSDAITYDLAIHDGKLYGLMWSKDGPGSVLCPAVANGNQAEPLVESDTSLFFHYEDMLYMATADSSLVKWKEGEEPQLVMEVFDVPWSVVTCGEYLYCGDYDARFSRIKLTDEQPQAEVLITNVSSAMIDGKHIYFEKDDGFLYRCDLDGSNPECLLQEKICRFNFDEEYVYYTLSTGVYPDPGNEDSYTVYRMRKDDPTQREKVAVLPDLIGGIYTVPGTGTLFVENWDRSDIVERRVFMVNIDGTGMKMLDIPEP